MEKICTSGHVFLGSVCSRCGGMEKSITSTVAEQVAEIPTIPNSVPEDSLPQNDLPKDEPVSKKKTILITKMKKVK